MKTHVAVLMTAVLCLCTAASAQKELSSDEIQQILGQLTSQPRETWIPAGTIEATHREYCSPKVTDPERIRQEIDAAVREYKGRAKKIERTEELQKMKLAAIPFDTRYRLANESTMDTSVTVKYDGQRFYWEIYINSRSDSVLPDATLAGNYMTDEINVDYNRHRIFVWDGAEYTAYCVSGNSAGVDAADRVPHTVTGPLTAGFIPWGLGRFSQDSLKAAVITATQWSLHGESQIQMGIAWQDGSSASFVLDPSKAYAVTACSLPGSGTDEVYHNYYGNYQQAGGNWVPSTILIERCEASNRKLLASDLWTLTSIDAAMPSPDSFVVKYDLDAQIEYSSPLTAQPVAYEYSPCVDTRGLLAERLAYEAGKSKRPQNCATAALGHVASTLGKTISEDTLATLVRADGATTLLDMKRLAEGLGLHCRAVHADLADLRTLGSAKAILYVPGKNHFVVLDSIEAGRVRIIDLSSQKFCYEQSVTSFAKRWSDGVALLVSPSPVTVVCKDIDGAAQAATAGGGGFACTRLIQEDDTLLCMEPCWGYYIRYFQRHGCEAAEDGECSTIVLYRYWKTLCGYNYQGYCDGVGDWYFAYIFACEHPSDWP